MNRAAVAVAAAAFIALSPLIVLLVRGAREISSLPSLLPTAFLTVALALAACQGHQRLVDLLDNLARIGVSLSAEDLVRINHIAPEGAAAGDRYPAAMMGMVGR